ncbi:MAG: hypothetical protein WD646_11905 [Actinomycetota bacterium]
MTGVYLGQYTDEVANAIAGELEAAAIDWSYKQAGGITKVFFIGEWGTRLFVDSERLDDARAIAERVSALMNPPTSK